MRRHLILGAWVALVLGGGLSLAAPGFAAARLDYRGAILSERAVSRLFDRPLAAPRDTDATRDALGELVTRLQDLGYTSASATARWSDARLIVEVHEGPRERIASVRFDSPTPADSAAFAAALGIRVGDGASPRALGDAMTRAIHAIADHGYPYASLELAEYQPESTGVALRLRAARGPAVTISDVRIDGLVSTRVSVCEHAMGKLTGVPYDRAEALDARDRLAQLGLFRSVAFAGLEGANDWSKGTLTYRVEELRYNRFEGAVGFQGDAGTAGLARLDLDNLMGTGRQLGLNWQSRGRGLADFGARYVEPLLFGAPIRLEGDVTQEVQDTIYVRTSWGARAQFSLSTQERIEAGFEAERVVQEFGDVQEADLQNSTFALERTTLDSPIAPRRGTRFRLSGAEVFKTETLRPPGKATSRASIAEARAEWHRPLTSATGLYVRLVGAGRFSSERILQTYERTPIGGAATLRGYDEEAFRVDRYGLSRVEWSRFLGAQGQRAFLFWDHAWMATRLADEAGGDHLDVLNRDGLGFGLELQAAGGLVGIDYGLAPGNAPLEGRIHLQLITTF